MVFGNFGNTCVKRRGGSSIVFVCMIMTVICVYVGHETLASREAAGSTASSVRSFKIRKKIFMYGLLLYSEFFQ